MIDRHEQGEVSMLCNLLLARLRFRNVFLKLMRRGPPRSQLYALDDYLSVR
jgi:hypothetical protein